MTPSDKSITITPVKIIIIIIIVDDGARFNAFSLFIIIIIIILFVNLVHFDSYCDVGHSILINE